MDYLAIKVSEILQKLNSMLPNVNQLVYKGFIEFGSVKKNSGLKGLKHQASLQPELLNKQYEPQESIPLISNFDYSLLNIEDMIANTQADKNLKKRV